MAGNAQFRVEHRGAAPRGWKIRTKLSGAHRIRIAFPPGPRAAGSGKLVEILHPKGGDNPCKMAGKNPSELVIFNPSPRRRSKKVKPPKRKRNTLATLLAGVAEQAGGSLVARKIVERKKPKHAKRRGRKNPEELEQAVSLYQTFQGKDPKGVLEMQRSAAMRTDYTALGDLIGLGLFVPGETVPEPDHWEGYPGAVKFARSGADLVKLASNAEGSQLYALGGNQDMLAVAEAAGADTSKDLIEVGELAFVVYVAKKAPDFQTVEWMHKFESPRPVLAYDKLKEEICFVGGGYSVEAPGITN